MASAVDCQRGHDRAMLAAVRYFGAYVGVAEVRNVLG